MNYAGSTCICRVPKAHLKDGIVVECTHCGTSTDPLRLRPHPVQLHRPTLVRVRLGFSLTFCIVFRLPGMLVERLGSDECGGRNISRPVGWRRSEPNKCNDRDGPAHLRKGLSACKPP